MSSFAPPTVQPEPTTDHFGEPTCCDFKEVVTELKALRETQEAVMELLSAIKEQVEPVLDGVANSPIGGMLGMKK